MTCGGGGRAKNLSQVRIRLRRSSRIWGVDVVPRRFPLISRQHGMSSNVACARSRGRTFEAMSKHVSRAIHSPSFTHPPSPAPPPGNVVSLGIPAGTTRAGMAWNLAAFLFMPCVSHLIVSWLSSSVSSSISIRFIYSVYFSLFFTSFGLKCTLTFLSLRVILIVGQHDTALDAFIYISPHSFKVLIFVKPSICNSHPSPCLL